jgi:hypothetical protein
LPPVFAFGAFGIRWTDAVRVVACRAEAHWTAPSAPACVAGRGALMTRRAFASASRSKRSDGSDTRSPEPLSVPETGPCRCWITWVSSCASVSLSQPPSPRTT